MRTLARKLRRASTDAERKLWYHLRSRRMLGYKFRRQTIIDRYIVDFVCLEAKLIIEADGGQHLQLKDADARRSRILAERGFRVLRFWNHEILMETDSVLDEIRQALIENMGGLP